MSYEILKGDTVWVERKGTGDGYWVDGTYFAGGEVVTYEERSNNFVEPFAPEEVEILPEGYSVNSSKWLLTGHVFNTYNESLDNATYADKVYLSDPTIGRKQTAWVVFDVEDWGGDSGLELLDDAMSYILIREDRLK